MRKTSWLSLMYGDDNGNLRRLKQIACKAEEIVIQKKKKRRREEREKRRKEKRVTI